MSDYIMDMRRLVGHRPLLQAGASVLLEDERGRLLLQPVHPGLGLRSPYLGLLVRRNGRIRRPD